MARKLPEDAIAGGEMADGVPGGISLPPLPGSIDPVLFPDCLGTYIINDSNTHPTTVSWVSGPVLRPLHALVNPYNYSTRLKLYHLHFTDGETEPQKGGLTLPKMTLVGTGGHQN